MHFIAILWCGMFTLVGSACTAGEPTCFTAVERQLPAEGTVTVYKADNSVVEGTGLVVLSNPSLLYLRLAQPSGFVTGVTIPLSRIDSLRFRKYSPVRGFLTITGFLAGIVVGASIGAGVARGDSDSRSYFDCSCIVGGLLGSLLGGTVGAYGGSELGRQFRITVTLRCR